MNITLTTTPEFLEQLEELLMRYENALDGHLYSIWPESYTTEAYKNLIATRDEMVRLITQAQTQMIALMDEGQ
jgi:hypothetical protein